MIYIYIDNHLTILITCSGDVTNTMKFIHLEFKCSNLQVKIKKMPFKTNPCVKDFNLEITTIIVAL